MSRLAPASILAAMGAHGVQSFRTGDPLFAFGPDLEIVSWNRAAEELTGVSAAEALGRYCWEVLGGHDERGNLVCHRGCSNARLAREGWPVACRGLLIKARKTRRRVDLSTVVVEDGDRRLFLHLMLPRREGGASAGAQSPLTPRQQQVLARLAPARAIAARLGLAEATVRNHVRGVLGALGGAFAARGRGESATSRVRPVTAPSPGRALPRFRTKPQHVPGGHG